jgi:hypothetical protein
MKEYMTSLASEDQVTFLLHLLNPSFSDEINNVSYICFILFFKDYLHAQYQSNCVDPHLICEFLGHITRFDDKIYTIQEKTVLDSDDTFWSKKNLIMHALNLFVYLMMRDIKNQKIWDTYTLSLFRKNFVEPLKLRINELNKPELGDQEKISDLELMFSSLFVLHQCVSDLEKILEDKI